MKKEQRTEKENRRKYKSLIKDVFIFALGSIGSKLIVFLLVPFYTYYLSPDEYGIADLVFTVSQLAIPVFSLVIFDAVVRFALSKDEEPRDALLVGVVVWIAGSALAVLCTPLIGLYGVIAEWKWYATAYISTSMLVSVVMNYLKATNKNLIYSVVSILQTLSLACFNIYFVAHKMMGIKGYLISYVGASVVAAVLAVIFGKTIPDLRRARFKKELAKKMIRYSSPLILNNLSWWVIQSSDKFMLESMVNDTALGIYTVAARIPSLITVFVTIFQQAWGISSIKEMEVGDNDKGFYSTVFNVYSFMAFLGGVGLCLVINPFMSVYVRSDSYGEVWRYVPLLLASAVFSAIAAYFGSMYSALKKSINNMLSTVVAAIVNIVVNFIAIMLLGLWGAMIGTIVAYVTLAFVRLIDVRRLVGMAIDMRKLVCNTGLIVAQVVVVSVSSVIIGVLYSSVTLLAFLFVNRKEVCHAACLVFGGKRNV